MIAFARFLLTTVVADIADEARSAEIDERQAVYDGIVKRERKTDAKKRVDHKKRSHTTDVSEGAKSDSMTDAFACGEEGLSCPGSCESRLS